MRLVNPARRPDDLSLIRRTPPSRDVSMGVIPEDFRVTM